MAISLSNIATGVRMKPPKIVLYGVGGIGKTSFAASAPSPIFLCTEEGQGLLPMNRFEPRPGDPILRSWSEIIECCDALLAGEHDYRTVVLDTIDFAEPLLWQHVCQTVPGPKGGWPTSIEDYGYGKGYIHAADAGRTLLQRFERLRNERGMAVIILAHNEAKKFEMPDLESHDRYKLKLQERLAHLVYDWADAVLFANFRAYITKDREEFNKERRRVTGLGERVLYTEERPAFWAKNRYSLPPELPFNRGSAWNDFVAAISVAMPRPTAPQSPPPTVEPVTQQQPTT